MQITQIIIVGSSTIVWKGSVKLLASPTVLCVLLQNNSVSPSDSLRAASEKHRGSSDYSMDSKKRKVEEKDSMSRYVSGRHTHTQTHRALT